MKKTRMDSSQRFLLLRVPGSGDGAIRPVNWLRHLAFGFSSPPWVSATAIIINTLVHE